MIVWNQLELGLHNLYMTSLLSNKNSVRTDDIRSSVGDEGKERRRLGGQPIRGVWAQESGREGGLIWVGA